MLHVRGGAALGLYRLALVHPLRGGQAGHKLEDQLLYLRSGHLLTIRPHIMYQLR